MICSTPTFASVSLEPTPERSRIAGDPSAPAEMTTSRRAVAVRTSGFASGWKRLFAAYSTPTARFPLHMDVSIRRRDWNVCRSLKQDLLHIIPGENPDLVFPEVLVVDVMMRYVRALPGLRIYPSANICLSSCAGVIEVLDVYFCHR